MQVARTRIAMRNWLSARRGRLGLVPTMGSLHPGHIALLQAARRECETVVATLFVNPTQFGPREDYETYPRDERHDLTILDEECVDMVFVPTVREMYPQGIQTTITMGRMGHILEGERRPTHLDGVATVVAQLFEATSPHSAYFGQKDWQQARVVAQLINDQGFNIELRIVETVREADGLACSSRNASLVGTDRNAATCIWHGLKAVRDTWEHGQRSRRVLEATMAEPIEAQSRVELGYAAVRHALTLDRVDPVAEPAVFLIAAQVGGVWLIDNIVRGTDPSSP